MAEILVRAIDNSNPNFEKDLMCYKRGMPVVVVDDGHEWGAKECLPNFVIIKVPLVPKAKVFKYRQEQMDDFDPSLHYRRREWRIRWEDLPQAAKNTLAQTGELIIKASPSYIGPYDYTWQQIKSFFRNLRTGLDETEDL